MTPLDFARDFIFHWEDGECRDSNKTHSLDPVDNGNWTSGRAGVGSLVGSNHGVTPTALATYRGVPTVTKDQMHALTIEEAAQIALSQYYHGPRLDLLDWNQATASLFDMGWGAGTVQAIKLMQRLIVVADDGKMGTHTADAFHDYVGQHGAEATAAAYGQSRNAYYDQVIAARPANAKYLKGWRNRTAYYLPGSPWWPRFAA